MLLTVVLNILATTTAIRVPTAWPEQATRAVDLNVAQSDYSLDVPFESQRIDSQRKKADNKRFFTSKLEHQPTAVVREETLRQSNKRPTGSHAKYVVRNNVHAPDLRNKHTSREPDVKHTPVYPRNKLQVIQHTNKPLKNNQRRTHYNHYGDYNRGSGHTRNGYNKIKNTHFSQPVHYGVHNLLAASDGWMPIVGQGQDVLYKIDQTYNAYAHNSNHQQNNAVNRRYSPLSYPYINPSKKHHMINKNYRDDHTHEEINDSEKLQENPEDTEDETAEEIKEQLPPRELENPSEVPTKPIYPGEGLWAVRGLKHRPFVKQNNYTRPLENDEIEPEGYQTFENAKSTFEKQHGRFQENLRALPLTYDFAKKSETENKEIENEESEEQHKVDEETDAFVPLKMLAQVRKTETEEHLPSNPEDARLREVIKDSRIHTVYTEEGYEDVAYDHAGHEKNAEDSEGHAESSKDAAETKVPKRKKAKLDEVDVARDFETYEKAAEEEDAEISASSYNSLKPDKNTASKRFATTKANVTTEIKNMDGDDMELEITSEVKIMTQPNNVSTAHKFVKIVPKHRIKQDLKEADSSAANSKIVLRRHKRFVNDLHKVDVNQDFFDVFVLKKPKSQVVVTTEKYPYYKVDTSVLNKNSPLRYAENLRNIPEKLPGRMSFYEQSRILECPNIPKNVDPIPDRVKKAQEKGIKGTENEDGEGYADQPNLPRLQNLGDKIDCIKDRLFGENPLDSPIFQETKIEAPDSIFKEFDFVNDIKKTHVNPESQLEVVNAGLAPVADYDSNFEEYDENDTHLSQNNSEDYENGDKYNQEESSVKEKHVSAQENYGEADHPDQNEVILRFTTKPQIPRELTTHSPTVISTTTASHSPTTVSTTTALTSFLIQVSENSSIAPKHIYDQIDIALKLKDEITTSAPVVQKPNNFEPVNLTTEPINITETEELAFTTISNQDDLIILGPKQIYGQIERIDTVDKISDSADLESSNRQPKSFETYTGSNLNTESTTELYKLGNTASSTISKVQDSESVPATAALRMLRRRRKRPQAPTVEIFDINKYLPTPLPTFVTYITTNSVLPKYKTISEVFYKDEIKPNEQLNVFADVINNIKNTPQEVLNAEGSEDVAVIDLGALPVYKNRKIRVPARKTRIKIQDDSEEQNADKIYITSSTTTSSPTAPRRRKKHKRKDHKTDTEIYEQYLQAIMDNDKDDKDSSESVEYESHYKPVASRDLLSATTTGEVLGLSPPNPTRFALSYSLGTNLISRAVPDTINSYPIFGLKPPSSRQPLVFPDFSANRIRRKNIYHRIHKRSPFKPNYSEIKRIKSQPESIENIKNEKEEDEYVPRRNRNFHYDVENDKVVYTNTNKKEEEEEAVPEAMEEEEEEEYLTLKPDIPKPKFVVVTTERNGPSFLDFVQVLKSNNNYVAIEEPKPKKISEENAADLKEVESTTTKQLNTDIPQFLSIISKLKSNKDYIPIKEEKAKPSTTTVSLEENEEQLEVEVEDVEESNANVKNSPGGIETSPSIKYDRSQIFDISEYLPQPRNYSPKTAIDYSRYKTIQRAPVPTRHNFSSRYNSEDDLPLNISDTMQTPIVGSNENIKVYDTFQKNGNRRIGHDSSEIKVVTESSTATTTVRTSEITTSTILHTTPHPVLLKVRGKRRRPTTTTTTPSSTTVSATSDSTSPKRRSRQRFRSTTTSEPLLEGTHSQTQRVVHRRIPVDRRARENQNVPPNHKAFYTPIVVGDANTVTEHAVVHRKRKASTTVAPQKVQLLEVEDDRKDLNMTEDRPKEQQNKKADVQVFKKYDLSKKHGGNYRKAPPDSNVQAAEVSSVPPTMYEIENSKEISRLTDVVPKPFAFYSDPTLPKSVNQLREPAAAEELPHDPEETEFPPIVKQKAEGEHDIGADEVKINFDKSSGAVTEKPVHFVKDPSKRLYYYAPVK